MVSWYASATGEIAASMTVFEFPPMLSLRSHVSIEFLDIVARRKGDVVIVGGREGGREREREG